MRRQFAFVLAAVTVFAALPWTVDHAARFVHAHAGFFTVLAAFSVCLFLAVGGHVVGSLSDRKSRRSGVSRPQPALVRRSPRSSGRPVHRRSTRQRGAPRPIGETRPAV